MRVAAIDVGTNSVKACVGESSGGSGVHFLLERSANTRLGEKTGASGILRAEAIDRTVAAIGVQLDAIRSLAVDRIRIVGTSAVREAKNADDFVARLKEEFGLELETLSGHSEARLSYAAISGDPILGDFREQQMVVDVGGGSTEMIHGTGEHMGIISSAKVGAVRFTEKFLQGDHPSECQVVDAAVMAERLLVKTARKTKVSRCVGIGGSVVNLARVWNKVTPESTEKVHGTALAGRELRKMIDSLVTLSTDDRRNLTGIEPERADILLAGAIILERAIAILGLDEIVVSTRGLRHGIVYELLKECRQG